MFATTDQPHIGYVHTLLQISIRIHHTVHTAVAALHGRHRAWVEVPLAAELGTNLVTDGER